MARRPQFSLWQVLEHKRRLEEQTQLRLLELGRQQALAVEELRLLHADGDLHRQRLAAREQEGTLVDLGERRSALAYLDGLEGRIAEQEALLAELDRAARQRRHELVEILKEKQMLERLQSRQEHAALERRLRREASEQDDINMQRYGREPRPGDPGQRDRRGGAA